MLKLKHTDVVGAGQLPFSRAARLFVGLVLLVACWGGGAQLYWVSGFLLGLGLGGATLISMHLHGMVEHGLRQWQGWLLLLLPLLLLVVLAGVRQWVPLLEEVLLDGVAMLRLSEVPAHVPGCVDVRAVWFHALVVLSVFVSAYVVWYILQAMSDVLFLLRLVLANGVLLSAYGILSVVNGSERVLGIYPRVAEDSFATYLNCYGWACYATLSLASATFLVIEEKSRKSLDRFLNGYGLWYVLGGLVVASSVFYLDDVVTRLLILVPLGVGILSVTVSLLRDARMPRGSLLVLVLSGLIGISLVLVSGGQLLGHAKGIWTDLPYLQEDAWAIAEMRPLWGWGAGSFTTVMALLGNADIASQVYAHPHSDWALLCLEQGYIAFVLLCAGPLVLLMRGLFLRRLTWGSSGLLLAVAWVLFAGLLDSPLRSVGVSFPLLLILVAALRLGEASKGVSLNWDSGRKEMVPKRA